jgi:hypothetical protein
MGMTEFPPPNLLSRLAKSITTDEAKAYGVDMNSPGMRVKGNDVYRDPPLTFNAPPSNWPTVAQVRAPMPRKIKGTIRGGAGAGRGDVPHDYMPKGKIIPMEKDPTPPYGIERPKL